MATARTDPDAATIEDLFALRWLSDPQLSPDGARIACVEERLDRDIGAMRSRVLVIGVDDGAVVTPSPDDAGDRAPRWSPDGSLLAFVGDRAGRAEVRIAEGGGRDSRGLPGSPPAAADPAWHPDGRRLAIVREAAPVDAAGPLHTVEGLRYLRDGQPVRPSAPGGLVIVDLDGATTTVDAGPGRFRRPAWSPAGDRLAWVRMQDGPDPMSGAGTIWLSGTDGRGTAPFSDGAGPVAAIGWSPDGERIAWLGHEKGECVGLVLGLRIARLAGGPIERIEPAGEPSLGLTVRSDDGRGMLDEATLTWAVVGGVDRLYTRWADGGRGPFGWIGLDGRVHPIIDGERAVLGVSVGSSVPRIAFVAADIDEPGELAVCDLDGDGERRVSDRTAPWRTSVRTAPTERIEATTSDGQPLEAWLTRPPGAERGPLPLVLSIHGGPHYPVGWRLAFEHQRLATSGYAVLSGNPRGSAGYGDAFATANHGDWGGVDHADLLALLDAALADDRLDPTRLGVTGVSYGGYMTLWMIARGDRFRSAICENGISDLISAAGTGQDAGALLATELGGPPWERAEHYRERSPLTYAPAIRAPLLLLHAELDRICPIGQSEQLYAALRRLERPVTFVRAPGEGHMMDLVGSAAFRRARAAAIDDWFARTL